MRLTRREREIIRIVEQREDLPGSKRRLDSDDPKGEERRELREKEKLE